MNCNVLCILFFLTMVSFWPSHIQARQETPKIIENPEYGVYPNSESSPVYLELDQSISPDLPPDVILSQIYHFDTDQNGNMYFYDSGINNLISLDPSGEVRWVTGQAGRGPGDFEDIRSFIVSDDELLVTNLNGNRLDRYDLDGNYLPSVNIPKETAYATLIGITPEDQLIVTTTLWGGFGVKIHFLKVTKDGLQRTGGFNIDQTGEMDIPQTTSFSSTIRYNEGMIWIGNTIKHGIYAYDLEGNLVQEISRDFDRMARPGFYKRGGQRDVTTFGVAEPPMRFPNGYAMAYTIWVEGISDPDYAAENIDFDDLDFRHSTDFYDPEGRLLYSIEGNDFSPETGLILHIDHNGFAYSVDTESEDLIKKYRLVIRKD